MFLQKDLKVFDLDIHANVAEDLLAAQKDLVDVSFALILHQKSKFLRINIL